MQEPTGRSLDIIFDSDAFSPSGLANSGIPCVIVDPLVFGLVVARLTVLSTLDAILQHHAGAKRPLVRHHFWQMPSTDVTFQFHLVFAASVPCRN